MEVTSDGVLIRHGGDGMWGPWQEVGHYTYLMAAGCDWPHFMLRLHLPADDQPTRYYIAYPMEGA